MKTSKLWYLVSIFSLISFVLLVILFIKTQKYSDINNLPESEITRDLVYIHNADSIRESYKFTCEKVGNSNLKTTMTILDNAQIITVYGVETIHLVFPDIGENVSFKDYEIMSILTTSEIRVEDTVVAAMDEESDQVKINCPNEWEPWPFYMGIHKITSGTIHKRIEEFIEESSTPENHLILFRIENIENHREQLKFSVVINDPCDPDSDIGYFAQAIRFIYLQSTVEIITGPLVSCDNGIDAYGEIYVNIAVK